MGLCNCNCQKKEIEEEAKFNRENNNILEGNTINYKKNEITLKEDTKIKIENKYIHMNKNEPKKETEIAIKEYNINNININNIEHKEEKKKEEMNNIIISHKENKGIIENKNIIKEIKKIEEIKPKTEIKEDKDKKKVKDKKNETNILNENHNNNFEARKKMFQNKGFIMGGPRPNIKKNENKDNNIAKTEVKEKTDIIINKPVKKVNKKSRPKFNPDD